ncbi:glycosyltransferase family 4 protein [uncultured Croceitalea sp.]|uniref:glycosyltransferase family 4 protein n=1 Tax=uncultured Croceitalea sp. TaxID=1798908 RepID=UPI0033057C06
MKKIVLVCSYAGSLIGFRGDFISELVKKGFQVYTLAPNMTDEEVKEIKNLQAIPLSYKLQRKGLNPINDFKTILELKSIIKEYDIDLVFPYTIKPVIYSSIAAKWLGVPVISLITGLGFTFSSTSTKSKILEKVTTLLYKKSIGSNKSVIFQNQDDYQLFLKKNILSINHPYKIVDGSGVNLERYSFKKPRVNGAPVKFVFVGRLIKEKGIQLYIEAAKKLKREFESAEFHILGSHDGSQNSVSLDVLNKLHEEGIVVYHGRQNDIASYLHKSDVFVLPTYYREGVPRSILEALSVGLPIITTDSPGCRETIKLDDPNGILVQKENFDELLSAMNFFLTNKDEINIMGEKSRRLAQTRFDVNIINSDILEVIDKVLN